VRLLPNRKRFPAVMFPPLSLPERSIVGVFFFSTRRRRSRPQSFPPRIPPHLRPTTFFSAMRSNPPPQDLFREPNRGHYVPYFFSLRTFHPPFPQPLPVVLTFLSGSGSFCLAPRPPPSETAQVSDSHSSPFGLHIPCPPPRAVTKSTVTLP